MNLKINDGFRVRDVKFFNAFSMNLRYDSVGSDFSFAFYFDPTNPDHRELACVSHFHEATVQHNGETLISGIILSEGLTKATQRQLVQVSGYSKPGVLEDCTIPVSLYPLESNGLTLREIATKYLKPFNIQFLVDSSVASGMDKPYEKITAEPTEKIKDLLCKLASQRDIVISHDELGRLLFTKAKTTGMPIAHFDGSAPATKISIGFNGQNIHSEITVIKQADKNGGNAGQFTIYNPYCPVARAFRPTTIIQESGDDNDTETAAKRAMAAELKNIPLTIELSNWDINEKVIRPNCLVSVTAPDLYIFKKTNFFVESVAYTGTATAQTCVLTCVLPEVYNGQIPKNIFVEPHSNSA